MNKLNYKSCFVSSKHLINDLGSQNKCQFCNKSLVDLRNKSEEEILSNVDAFNGVCVIPNETSFVDNRTFLGKIVESTKRALRIYSGIKAVYYVSFFVVMTVFSSCVSRKKVPSAGYVFKQENDLMNKDF